MNLIDEDDGTVLVTSHFPELSTFGGDRAEGLVYAVAAFEEAIASRIPVRMDVPSPTPSEGDCVYLETLTVAKVMLCRAMRDAHVSSPSCGAVSTGTLPASTAVLDPSYQSRVARIDRLSPRPTGGVQSSKQPIPIGSLATCKCKANCVGSGYSLTLTAVEHSAC